MPSSLPRRVPPPSGRLRCSWTLWVVLLVVLALWGVVAALLLSERERTVEAKTEEMRRLVASVGEEVGGILKLAEVGSLSLTAEGRSDELSAVDASAGAGKRIARLTKLSDDLLEFARDGGLADAAPTAGGASAADGRVVVGAPQRTPDLGWAAPLSFPRSDSSSSRVVARLRLDRLVPLFDAQRNTPNGSITLVRADGVTLFRTPGFDRAVGVSIAATPDFIAHLATQDGGAYRIQGAYDGVERIVAFARLPGCGLVVAATASLDDTLEAWRQRLIGLVLLLVGVSGAAVGAALRCEWVAARSRRALERSASHDGLTGLPNRLLFADRLALALAQAQRSGGHVAVAYLDLDGFKAVNDTLGHPVGDQLLIEVSRRIQATLREGDTLARLGGDEFALILDGLDSPGDLRGVIERILRAAGTPVVVSGANASVSASIGLAFCPGAAADPEGLERCADDAMYAAKRAGGNRCCVWGEVEPIAAAAAGWGGG